MKAHRQKDLGATAPSFNAGRVTPESPALFQNALGELSFQHRFEKGSAERTLLLLHGTGGDENQLVSLARSVDPEASILSPRGAVDENGNLRFFRRNAEGVLDEADMTRRASDLSRFIVDACRFYRVPPPFALGYSNGANMAAAMALLYPGILRGLILLRAVAPFRENPPSDLAGMPALLVSGANDEVASVQRANELESGLRRAGAAVTHHILPLAHDLSQSDGEQISSWLSRVRKPW